MAESGTGRIFWRRTGTRLTVGSMYGYGTQEPIGVLENIWTLSMRDSRGGTAFTEAGGCGRTTPPTSIAQFQLPSTSSVGIFSFSQPSQPLSRHGLIAMPPMYPSANPHCRSASVLTPDPRQHHSPLEVPLGSPLWIKTFEASMGNRQSILSQRNEWDGNEDRTQGFDRGGVSAGGGFEG